ncbi:UNVERIFIED_CONTAM: hypothetical protein Scaly_2057400 [Sesamum calycinum]|uniref:Uncharacterized protein n=1 Tax=Sesamum calycinum TaxID=2727403 RepID=A0AAW2N4A4_9LAMI
MSINSEPSTPTPRIGKIGPYTVFMTPPATPSPRSEPESPSKISPVETTPVETTPVMAPPAQFYKERPSSFGFLWDAVAKVQNAHASLDEHVAHWFGLNQSKYQWALDDYYENNQKNPTETKHRLNQAKQRMYDMLTGRVSFEAEKLLRGIMFGEKQSTEF